MTAAQCLTFLTDYGTADAFVGACRGVAARIAPDVPVVDITHQVPRGDVRRGAALLAQAAPFFPPAVHVAVVDPGVGTDRRGIAVAAGHHLLVGPDNGLLPWAATAVGGASRAVSLTNEELWVRPVSHTFHGRDIFMPVGAHLATGVDLAMVGDEIDLGGLVTLPGPVNRMRDDRVDCEVLTVDQFGNVQLSVPAAQAERAAVGYGSTVLVRWAGGEANLPFLETFASVPHGDLVALADGAGLVSLAVNGGNAAERLGLRTGDQVALQVAP